MFSDFYLFKKLLGLDPALIESQAEGWLKTLRIQHKVTIRDGEYSTINLSQGQRKRLALVTAMLEDRPFYVFDEWAADQDPQYKEVFTVSSCRSCGREEKVSSWSPMTTGISMWATAC